MSAALLQLRDRLKAAMGPDWGLSVDIELALVPGTRDRRSWDSLVAVGLFEKAYNPPDYTGSLDAALTLVPNEDADFPWFWRVGHDGEGPDPAAFKAELLQCSVRHPMATISAVADTPELALCLARVEHEIQKAQP